MKIGIIGGGNLGSVLAVNFSLNNDVILYTNLVDKVDEYKPDMQVFCEDTNSYKTGKNIRYTTSLKQLAENSFYIFITFPSFMFEALANDLIPHLNKNHHLVFIPGSGGAELFFKGAIEKGATITGLQRVHAIARIIEFGKLIKESGIKPKLRIASVPSLYNDTAAEDLNKLYNIPVEKLDNYLNVTFVNSNPILHTSRLYTIFKDYPTVKEYPSMPLFYEGWDIPSSSLLIKMDDELFKIIGALKEKGLHVSGIEPLLKYYESHDAESLTKKLSSITAFKGIGTPSVRNENGTFSPDLNSRYFTADFPYGLDILLSFGRTIGLKLHNMEMVSNWYHRISKNADSFSLEKFGINCIEDITKFYK